MLSNETPAMVEITIVLFLTKEQKNEETEEKVLKFQIESDDNDLIGAHLYNFSQDEFLGGIFNKKPGEPIKFILRCFRSP